MKRPFLKIASITVFTLYSAAVFPEAQNGISLTAPSFSPGTGGSFNVSQVSGSAAAGSGTLTYTYSGQVQLAMSSGSGRFGSLGAVTRMGMTVDSFLIFQSFLTNNYLTVASSNTTCPSATDYTWLTYRHRTPDLTRSPNDLSSTTNYIGGTINYDPASNPKFSGVNYFDAVGPTLTANPTYGYNGMSGASCSSASMKYSATQSDMPLNQYGTLFFGSHGFIALDYTGNPNVFIGLPKQTLDGTVMSSLANDVLTGRYTYFTNVSTQDQKNIYLIPDASGTTFTLKSATDLTDTTLQANLGTLTCTSLNTPTTGFCSGTLTLNGVSGTGNAVCHLYAGSDEHIVSCSAQYPSSISRGVGIYVGTPKTGLLATSLSGHAVTSDSGQSTTVTATLTNRSGRPIPTIGNASASSNCPSVQDGALCAPFNNTGAFAGNSHTGGACGTSLKGYGSCTVTINYEPNSRAVTLETFRVSYNSGGGGTVNSTAKLVGAAALQSIAVTPGATSYAAGGTTQLTATATFTGGGTQDVTSAVTWGANNSNATVNSTGQASWVSSGTTDMSATIGSVPGATTYTISNTPVLTSVADQNFPSNYLAQGANFSVNINNTTTGDDTGMTYACVYDQTVDGAVASGTNCTSLGGTATFNTSTGVFSWTPDTTVWGAYEIKVSGTKSGDTGTRIFVIDVRPGLYTTNLRGYWDAQFADKTAPYSSNNTSWKDLSGNSFDATTSSTSHVSWTGSGSTSSPYTASIDGSGNIDFGASPLNSQTKMMFSAWVNSTSPTSLDKVILGNSSDATGNGFTVRQSNTAHKIELLVGSPSYQAVVLADTPLGYWRLGDSSMPVQDSSGNGKHQSNPSGLDDVTLSASGALTGNSNTAATFDGVNDQITLPTLDRDTLSVEMWLKRARSSAGGTSDRLIGGKKTNAWGIGFNTANTIFFTKVGVSSVDSTGTIADTNWHHFVLTYDGSTAKFYIDGADAGTSSYSTTFDNTGGIYYIGNLHTGSQYFQGSIDEVAVYTSILSQTQVTNHYNAGLGYLGCLSSSYIRDGKWNLISGLYDGSTAKLFLNGIQQCSVSVSSGFTSPSTNLVAGATASNTKQWTGKISELEMYGTSDGSAVATSTNVKTNFSATVPRYRGNAPGIVTSNLVLNLDAAYPDRITPYSAGCAYTDKNWIDLSSSDIVAALTWFYSCDSTTGWNGNGTTSINGTNGPYRLNFDKVNDYIDLGNASALDFEYSSTFSMEAWINTTNTSASYLLTKYNSIWDGSWAMSIQPLSPSGMGLNFKMQGDPWDAAEVTGNTDIGDGNWHHVVVTYSGNGGTTGMKLYVDGTQQTLTTVSNNLNNMTIRNSYSVNIGAINNMLSGLYGGAIAKMAVYSSTLSQADVTQNCNALATRFSGVTCH